MHRFRRIVLHPGPGKTGSTSIQTHCFKHREQLLEQGVLYPAFTVDGTTLSNHSGPLVGALCQGTRLYGLRDRHGMASKLGADPDAARKEFLPQLEALFERPGPDTLLLSGEVLADFDPVDRQAVRSYLESRCETLDVVAYLRSPASSLESILQQRVTGSYYTLDRLDPAEPITRVVRQRYEALEECYGERLLWIDFHRAQNSPGGLLESFFSAIGIEDPGAADVDSPHRNPRPSHASILLMSAINQALHPKQIDDHGVRRSTHDMAPLRLLPGPPFRLESLTSAELRAQVEEDTRWLEQETGFSFPPWEPAGPVQPWTRECLLQLEDAAGRLHHPAMQRAVADELEHQADAVDDETATLLRFIATRLRRLGPAEAALQALGADYFKYAALQEEPVSTERTLELLALALHLRPDGKGLWQTLERLRSRLPERGLPQRTGGLLRWLEALDPGDEAEDPS